MRAVLILILFCGATLHSRVSYAVDDFPRTGWEAELSMDFHDVSGTVTIVDQDTFRVDDFTYDGDGIAVYFYLGASDDPMDFASGLQIGNDLVGAPFNGSEGSMLIDLPAATTLDGYNAVSVWCVAASVSFGSGAFAAVLELSILSDLTGNGFVDFDDLTILLAHWDQEVSAGQGNLVDPLNTRIDFQDLTFLLADWTGPGPVASPEAALGTEAVPEPSSLLLALVATLGVCCWRRRQRAF